MQNIGLFRLRGASRRNLDWSSGCWNGRDSSESWILLIRLGLRLFLDVFFFVRGMVYLVQLMLAELSVRLVGLVDLGGFVPRKRNRKAFLSGGSELGSAQLVTGNTFEL